MAIQVFIGLTTEGPTDMRFLMSVVERTFIDIAFECNNDVEPFVKYLDVEKSGLGFSEYVERASRQGIKEMGINVLCVHTDADSKDTNRAYSEKINPAKVSLEDKDDKEVCKNLVPVIPVRMMEAWMLADKKLLKEEIGTDISDEELGINRMPESFADPKEVISNAIVIARRGVAKRRKRDLDICDLYAPIGTRIGLEALMKLPSYNQFREEVRMVYRSLNLLV